MRGALTLTHFSAEKQGGYQDLIFKRGKRRELAIGRFGTMGRTLRDLADNTTAVEGPKNSKDFNSVLPMFGRLFSLPDHCSFAFGLPNCVF